MELSQATKIFKALSCDQRLKLLQLIRKWNGIDKCCDGVVRAFTRASEELKISKSTISHHFKELENSGLILCQRNGQSASCCVNEKLLEEVLSYVAQAKSV
jgi:ArsR family transcriptional regulator, arsenate/arsenite/antimonite-responsive transcriptional repressor